MARRPRNDGQMSFTDALRGIQDAADDAGTPPSPPPPSPPPVVNEETPPETDPRPLSVTEACRRVNLALETIESGEPFEVEGEVGDCSLRDHWYFTLKDGGGSKLSCAFFSFRRRMDRNASEPRVGMKMVATGRPELYAKGGRLSFVVTRLREAGLGDLHQRFERLKGELRDRGWFDADQRIPLPTFARRILVLTSPDAAALRDVVETARRRWPGMELLLAPIRVQGDQATPEIARAVRLARKQAASLGADAIVLTRGGGSLEDLWCFNEESVATAIHESRVEALAAHRAGGAPPVPLVAAIGHESDVSIAELVADHRASTPTQAMMELVPEESEQREYLDGRASRLGLLLERIMERARGRCEVAARHEILRRPERMVEPHRRRMDEAGRELTVAVGRLVERADRRLERLGTRLLTVRPDRRINEESTRLDRAKHALGRVLSARIDSHRTRLDHLSGQLRVVGPESILARGYALVLDGSGQPVRAAGDLATGDVLTTRFQKGAAQVRVESVDRDEVR